MAELAPPDLMALTYIARNLRERDAAEVLATSVTDPDSLAVETFQAGPFQWVAWDRDTPVASIGARCLWAGVWGVWAFGTDLWPRVVLSLTRHVRRVMIPSLLENGVHRAQCAALASHEDARRWLSSLGAKPEATLRGFGRGGEDFVIYAWRRNDVLRGRRQR